MAASPKLSGTDFKQAIALVPLISIDFLVYNKAGQMLVGFRVNEPAFGKWFVPGGRVFKNEPLRDAFIRLSKNELGQACNIESSVFVGVYEHFYCTDFTGNPNATTHYIVLAYKLILEESDLVLTQSQHSAYRWLRSSEALIDENVHENTRTYFLLG